MTPEDFPELERARRGDALVSLSLGLNTCSPALVNDRWPRTNNIIIAGGNNQLLKKGIS